MCSYLQHLASAVSKLIATGEIGWASGGELDIGNPVRRSKTAAGTRARAEEAETKGGTSASEGGEEKRLLGERRTFKMSSFERKTIITIRQKQRRVFVHWTNT